MKTIKLSLILLIIIVFFSISCTKEEAIPKEEQFSLDFTDTNFNFMNEEFSFEGSKEKMKSDLLSKLESTIFNDNLFVDESEVGIIKWEVSLLGDKILVKQTVEEGLPKNTVNSETFSTKGLKKYTSCSGLNTKSCTKEKAGELADKLKEGETFSVTRTGFASTIIYGTAALIDRSL